MIRWRCYIRGFCQMPSVVVRGWQELSNLCFGQHHDKMSLNYCQKLHITHMNMEDRHRHMFLVHVHTHTHETHKNNRRAKNTLFWCMSSLRSYKYLIKTLSEWKFTVTFVSPLSPHNLWYCNGIHFQCAWVLKACKAFPWSTRGRQDNKSLCICTCVFIS